MTCIPGGQANCGYPRSRCEQARDCRFTLARRNPRTGLTSPLWGWGGFAFMVPILLAIFALLGFAAVH